MKYSVVIPAYNASPTLAETIESVLKQAVPASRIIVVDDGSTDNTVQIAKSFGDDVEVVSQANAGPGAAMSRGLRMTETPYLAALDSDDLWLPHKMGQQLDFLAKNPNCGGVFCPMRLFGESVTGERIQEAWGRSVMTIRREVFDTIGDVVDPPGMRGEMIDWIARAREAGFVLAMMPEVLAMRRVLRGSLSDRRDSAKDRGYAHVARAALLRRRAKQLEAESHG